MLVAKTKKVGEYWKAVIQVQEGEYKQNYYSFNRYFTREDALNKAKRWKNECDYDGYIVQS